ncbi:MAG: histidinol-phosphatase HisJ family protein [Eubacteriales bacterium]|nr:histidinol-phosphatase HisJ family protein [Eubacteriales bacterium]
MIKSNPHTHTQFGDGRSTAEEMVLSALDNGFLSLGFSEHGKQSFNTNCVLDENREAQYIEEIKRLKEKYKDKIRIYLGVERDAYSLADRRQYEYVLGSVHYVKFGDKLLAVDGNAEELNKAVNSYFNGDGFILAKEYYKNISEYIAQYKPHIIGHFDLVCKYNSRYGFFDEQSPEYIELCRKATDNMIKACSIMEVNTGRIVRAKADTPYPSLEILKYWRHLGGDVILSSDCHDAKDIAGGYEKGLAHIRKAGFKTILQLSYEGSNLFTRFSL